MGELYHSACYRRGRPVGTYWAATVPAEGLTLPDFRGGEADVAIVGAGLTGLAAARRLAELGYDTVVIDGAGAGWGASGRNGGFACLGGSKLSLSDISGRYGEDEAKRFFCFQQQAVDELSALVDRLGVDVDRSGSGELELAHNRPMAEKIAATGAHLRDRFGCRVRWVPREELSALGAWGPRFFGGLLWSDGFGINPAKLVRGLAESAVAAGVRFKIPMAVETMEWRGGAWHLAGPGGPPVVARQVLLATNGYGRDRHLVPLSGRLLPVLSNIIVTRPLRREEREAQGWTSHVMAYDSRDLLHYFRLLPDNRLLVGGRGGISGRPGAEAAAGRRLHRELGEMFPHWRGVEVDYSWRGLVCFAPEFLARIGPAPTLPSLWFAGAYHGNGVTMAPALGSRVAEWMDGRLDPANLPRCLIGWPARFPFAGWRKAGLAARYGWYVLKDRFD